MNSLRWFHFSTLLCLTCCFLSAPASAKWKYLRAGNATDSTKTPLPGFALMGGGAHQDPAFKWLCERTNGGDFLVLSAHDDDAYMKKLNQEMQAVCPLNSAATLSFTNREDSSDPKGSRNHRPCGEHLPGRRRSIRLRALLARHSRARRAQPPYQRR